MAPAAARSGRRAKGRWVPWRPAARPLGPHVGAGAPEGEASVSPACAAPLKEENVFQGHRAPAGPLAPPPDIGLPVSWRRGLSHSLSRLRVRTSGPAPGGRTAGSARRSPWPGTRLGAAPAPAARAVPPASGCAGPSTRDRTQGADPTASLPRSAVPLGERARVGVASWLRVGALAKGRPRHPCPGSWVPSFDFPSSQQGLLQSRTYESFN